MNLANINIKPFSVKLRYPYIGTDKDEKCFSPSETKQLLNKPVHIMNYATSYPKQ